MMSRDGKRGETFQRTDKILRENQRFSEVYVGACCAAVQHDQRQNLACNTVPCKQSDPPTVVCVHAART